MKKFNLKNLNLRMLNLSAWLILISTYLLPYRYTDGFETSYGYPIPFISIHNVPIGKTPFSSMYVNALALIFDVLIIYIVLLAITEVWKKFKNHRNI